MFRRWDITRSLNSSSHRQTLHNYSKPSQADCTSEDSSYHTMLCEKCSNIHFKPLQDCELPLHNFVLAERELSDVNESGCVFYFHHDSKQSLQASAEEGCHFCGMLYGHFFRIQRSHRLPAHRYSFSYKGVTLRRSIIENWIARNYGFQGWNDGDWIYINFDDKASLTTTSRACFEGTYALTSDRAT